ncbi:MAG: exodeoxyribonuclease VII large subunit [Bacteroidales bacterium]|nr:exodeoxyribonuclease VII large subunit [Bacteroidales bacterium]
MEAFSLYELNGLVRDTLRRSFDGEYWVEAEIAEARRAANGHFYLEFIQKDDSGRNIIAKARGTLWARTYAMLVPLFERATGERLRAGLKVRVQVTVEFHEVYGYALNITDIDPSYTLGDMAARRREILQQLEADGIIDDNRQLPLPALLKRIAVVSSSGAAGYGDFCDQLLSGAHGFCFEFRLFPAVMQGANVEESVLCALETIADEADRWDCVVIIRGGGATSDLSDFDSYALAAAVAQMPLPVIVGIGHERDETVLDFVAHTRVKTPTAAAAFLIDHAAAQLSLIGEWHHRIVQAAQFKIQDSRLRLQHLTAVLPRAFALVGERRWHRLEQLSACIAAAPQRQLSEARQHMLPLSFRLTQAIRLQVERSKFQLDHLGHRLAALDPQRLLRRGYSLTYSSDGHLVRSVADVQPGDDLVTRFADGTVISSCLHIDRTHDIPPCSDTSHDNLDK